MSTEPVQTKASGFWESRTSWSWLKRTMLLEPLPGGSRWAAAFGSLLLFTIMLQAITGILLTMNYAPSEATAYPSVKFIQEEVPVGWFIRALHHWGASAMVILLLFHLVQVFVWGAYKRPRELTWMVGVVLLVCTLGLAFTGYLLPWDQKAYWASKVGLDIVGTVPLLGGSLQTLLQGGSQIGNLTLTRFFTLHAFVLPGLLILLVVVHLYLFRLHGVTPPWWESPSQIKAEAEPFWPYQAWKDGVLALVLLVGLAVWCFYRPAPLEAKADPSEPYAARPEWYFMFLFRLLRYFEGRYEILGTFVLPTLFFLLLFFWPLLDRNPHRDPRRRPLAMALLGSGTVGLVGLTIFAIATDVRMVEPASAVAKTQPDEPAGLVQKLDIAKAFNTNCAACHGVDGTGDHVRKGMPTIPNFSSLAWQMSQTDIEITHQILDGKEPLMPAYEDKLSKQQILGLSVYIRAFAIHPGAPNGPKLEKLPPTPIASQMSPVHIYRAYCLACHDADGRGETVRKAMPEIPDFTNAKWQELRTDADLRHSILDGKGKFMLPMKDKVGEAEAGQMVAFIRAFHGRKQIIALEPQERPIVPEAVHPAIVAGPKVSIPASGVTTPSAKMAARLRVATGLFRQYCVTCHGPEGRGTAMRASMPPIPDFTERTWQKGHSDPQLRVSILDGKGVYMPAFGSRLSTEQARDLIAYVRAFGAPEANAAAAPASDFDKRFQQLQHQWDELDKQLHRLSPQTQKP
jgi:quinol-cytochrome oxidoreductase complex cytochrome b subunit/mono/diheme cytochrome c family protein